jgi:hypothetical protein
VVKQPTFLINQFMQIGSGLQLYERVLEKDCTIQ